MIAPARPRMKHHPRPAHYRLYQFRITLRFISPSIWRVIQVPETYSFWDLHVAIQDAMGWHDCHLHEFALRTPKGKAVRIQIPAELYGEHSDGELTDWEEFIANYFTPTNTKAVYTYDFGDSWTHDIGFEGVFPKAPKSHYPTCIAGERTCPPEDCGGAGGYEELCEAMKDKLHPRHKELVDWLGHEYYPDAFTPEAVRFDNPRLRFQRAFGR